MFSHPTILFLVSLALLNSIPTMQYDLLYHDNVKMVLAVNIEVQYKISICIQCLYAGNYACNNQLLCAHDLLEVLVNSLKVS